MLLIYQQLVEYKYSFCAMFVSIHIQICFFNFLFIFCYHFNAEKKWLLWLRMLRIYITWVYKQVSRSVSMFWTLDTGRTSKVKYFRVFFFFKKKFLSEIPTRRNKLCNSLLNRVLNMVQHFENECNRNFVSVIENFVGNSTGTVSFPVDFHKNDFICMFRMMSLERLLLESDYDFNTFYCGTISFFGSVVRYSIVLSITIS